ncbi:hypothetical protein CHUAL_010353 [Chamberlinius hualienensis]
MSMYNSVIKSKTKEVKEPQKVIVNNVPDNMYEQSPDIQDTDSEFSKFYVRNSSERMSVSRSGRFKQRPRRRSSLFDNLDFKLGTINQIDDVNKTSKKPEEANANSEDVTNRENQNPDTNNANTDATRGNEVNDVESTLTNFDHSDASETSFKSVCI